MTHPLWLIKVGDPQFVRGRRDGRSRRRQRLDQRLDVLVLTDVNQVLEKKMSGEEERRETEQCAGNECACLRQIITTEEIREPDLSCRLSNQKTSYTNAHIMVSNISYKLSKPLCLSKMAVLLKCSCKSLTLLYYHKILDSNLSSFNQHRFCISFWNWLFMDRIDLSLCTSIFRWKKQYLWSILAMCTQKGGAWHAWAQINVINQFQNLCIMKKTTWQKDWIINFVII